MFSTILWLAFFTLFGALAWYTKSWFAFIFSVIIVISVSTDYVTHKQFRQLIGRIFKREPF